MKTKLFLFPVLFCMFSLLESFQASGQSSSNNLLKVEVYSLDNGLTVYLNEDHTLPKVFGGVAVKGGSKRDPANATGIAHYFEHIMFKGTDKIGTLDYKSEKTYLDSIASLYDKLSGIDDPENQLIIQTEINRLSIKASEYAIPNELESILSEMGSSDLNAGTGNDAIFYYDIVPSNQVEKWLEVYSHRFINPVYRLFQSELETIYEEYNMDQDDRFYTAYEKFMEQMYPVHPYGVPVIGYPEHLKKPSMSEMDKFFRTYYVANNMALVLSGNFNSEEIKPVIQEKFGQWKSGEIPVFPEEYKVDPFEGRTVFKKRLSPIKFGILGFRSVPSGHKDEPVLDLINRMLINESKTGLLDRLVTDNKLMWAEAEGTRYTLAGDEIIVIYPKIIGQSIKKGEELVLYELEKIKRGDFDESFVEAVKTEMLVEYQQFFEDQITRGWIMVQSFVNQQDWQEVLDYKDHIEKINRDDIVAAALKYYGDDYLAFYAKTGLPKKKKIEKPPFNPVLSGETKEQSEYAKELSKKPVIEIEPEFIEFGEEKTGDGNVQISKLSELTHIFRVKNPVNDIFSLKIKIGIGTYRLPVLNQLTEYIQLIGTENNEYASFNQKLQKLGTTWYAYCDKDYFTMEIYGLDKNLDESLALISELLYHPLPETEKIKLLYQTAKSVEKYEKNDGDELSRALYEYIRLGGKSGYLNRLSAKEVKNLLPDTLLSVLDKILQYETFIHYSGTQHMDELKKSIGKHLNIEKIRVRSTSPEDRILTQYSEPTIFIHHDKNPIQSNIYFLYNSDPVEEADIPYMNAYNEFLDGGMHSLLFQEIREMRSLAYSTGGMFVPPFYKDENGYLVSYIGTQADKSMDACETMLDLLNTTPDRHEKTELIKQALIQKINSEKPDFRNISEWAEKWYRQGYSADPRQSWIQDYKELDFEDIVDFHNKYIKDRPMIIGLVGDTRKIDKEKLKTFGEVKMVSKKNILK